MILEFFVSSVIDMMYSFQKDRKLNRITVMMLGSAIGIMIFGGLKG